MGSDAIRPGDVIGGRYRVQAILSRSRGFLVDAVHSDFDQRVVIRVLPAVLSEPKEVKRFQREARILTKLESEHVARLLDIGTLPDGALFFVRPYLEGIDLASYLKSRGALPIEEATLLILQAAEAVAESHVHSFILRELSPAHLFLTQRVGGEPLLKVIDFGTAKLLRDPSAAAGGELTATSMFGLSCYSSPEVVRKLRTIDTRTDIWSLGTIFYQMLAGRLPFDGEMAVLMLQICREMPPALSSLRPDIPSTIGQIIGWAMAKEAEGRFANVYGFAHALAPFASSEGKLLIQRIGTMTAAAEQRRKSAPSLGSIPPEPTSARDEEPPRAARRADRDRDSPTLIRDAKLLLNAKRPSPRPPMDTQLDAPAALPLGPAAPVDEALRAEETAATRRSVSAPMDREATRIEQPSAALLFTSAGTDHEATRIEQPSAALLSTSAASDPESTKVGEPPAALLATMTATGRESRTEQRVLIDLSLVPSVSGPPSEEASHTSSPDRALELAPRASLEDSKNLSRGEMAGAAGDTSADGSYGPVDHASQPSVVSPSSSRDFALQRAPSGASLPALGGAQPAPVAPGTAAVGQEVTRATALSRPPAELAASTRVRAHTKEVRVARAAFATALLVLLGALGFAFFRGYSKGDGALHAAAPRATASVALLPPPSSTPETPPATVEHDTPSPSAEPPESDAAYPLNSVRSPAQVAAAKALSTPTGAAAVTSTVSAVGPTASAAVTAGPLASTAPTGSTAASAAPSAEPAPVAPPAEDVTAAPPAVDSREMGTLIAVAVGGSCAFSINDASKGTLSTLKVQMKAGTYVVTCRPASSDAQTKSVNVTKGGAAMVTFKIP